MNLYLKSNLRHLSPLSRDGQIRWPQTLIWYCISHGFLILSWNALYWDDWYVYADGPAGVSNFFSSCERCTLPLRGQFEGFLLQSGPWLMRLIVFLVYPLMALITNSYLIRTRWLSEFESSVLSLIIIFLPTFGARVALINFQYSFLLFLFVVASRLTLHQNFILRLLALPLFFWSLFMPSLQVFIVVPMTIMTILLYERRSAWRSYLYVLVALSFPLIHRFVLPQVFPELAVRDGYNSIQPAFLARSLFVTVPLVLPFVVVFFRKSRGFATSREKALLAAGLAVLGVGTFPYMAVGHFANLSDWITPFLPDQSDWDSRHQALQIFGYSLIFLSAAKGFDFRVVKILGVLFLACVGTNVATYSGYYLDAMKQREFLVEIAKQSSKFQGVNAVVIEDNSPRFNARGRGLRAYEWTAMVSRASDSTVKVDQLSVEYCADDQPAKRLKVDARTGRLRALLTGEIGISVEIDGLPICNSTNSD